MIEAQLKRVALLGDLADGERESLAEYVDVLELTAGRAVFEEGSEGEGLIFVVDGEVELESREAGKLGRASTGATLGGLGLLVAGRHECTALAAGPCTVAYLGKGSFRRMFEDEPRLAGKILEGVVREAASLLREALPALRQALPSAPNDGQG